MCDIAKAQRHIFGCLGGSDPLKGIMLITNAGSLSNKHNDVTRVIIFVVEEGMQGEEIVFPHKSFIFAENKHFIIYAHKHHSDTI